jgi:hypothetical protein
MTPLSVRVHVDEEGNATVDFDKSALRSVPLEELMREVAANAEKIVEAFQGTGPTPASPPPAPSGPRGNER